MVEAPSPDAMSLISTAMSTTPMCWLAWDAMRARPVWHVWHDEVAYVISGGMEQPLPGVEAADEVRVTVRSKDSGARLLTWIGRADALVPTSPAWNLVVDVVLTARLNIAGGTAARRELWAAESVLTRLTPDGRLLESLNSMPTGSLAAPPPASPAVTRGRLPRVLHRRPRSAPPL